MLKCSHGKKFSTGAQMYTSLYVIAKMIVLTVSSRSHPGEPAFKGGRSPRNRRWCCSLLHLLQEIQCSLQVTHSETATVEQLLLRSGKLNQLLLQGNRVRDMCKALAGISIHQGQVCMWT